MATVVLQIPEDVSAKLMQCDGGAAEGLRLAAAFSLCERGELSTSQAARLAGLSYVRFLEAAATAKVSLFSIESDDLSEEIARGFSLGRQRLSDHPARKSKPD